ncbi:hypothetical protein ABZ832_05255 [Streptantibioticus parmotrematis]|uniref:hypothetical protein n=1 Tax=Streptantibioticus parmotrematis TaxID=2873249 RepID=UPI0033DF493F
MASSTAPKPPLGTPFRIRDDLICVGSWSTAAKGASVQTVDGTGKRVTVTRLALAGPFAFALKKKTGDLSVVVCGADGTTRVTKIGPKKAQDVMAWAIAFNAWAQA